jgi:hypothetical protein
VPPLLNALQSWLESTRLSYFMIHSDFAWPICESLHFLGLSLVIGTVGLFDLRMLGVARGLSLRAMHRLIGWGVLGFLINVITGAMFFAAIPYQYIYNGAFQAKMVCILLLGMNVLIFYLTVHGKVEAMGPEDAAPLGAKMIAGTSLFLWIAVICFGRAEAFFKP